MFSNIGYVFQGSCLEAETDDLHWNIVNIFHHKINRLERVFDQMNYQLRTLMREQDGTEIKSGMLEQLTDKSRQTSRTVEYFETIRDHAAKLYTGHTGRCWMPAQGSKANRQVHSSSARDHIKAEKVRRAEALTPEGSRVIIAGGMDYSDHTRVYAALDALHTRHSDLVLLHGGAPKGVDHIAAKWANNRDISQIIFKPDWNKHGRKRAGFVRNEDMIAANPIGAIIFPGFGVTENLADKARAQGITVKRYA
ncbi:MAG: DUF2493 domain-containing protein [Alphaproteobacteria bacterium]|nr:DUF2493 domain-containing protein [Alphaproteobacteria bacterium]